MIYWYVREDGWIADYTWYGENTHIPEGYTTLPDGVTQADLAPWPDLWYINGALVQQPMPEE